MCFLLEPNKESLKLHTSAKLLCKKLLLNKKECLFFVESFPMILSFVVKDVAQATSEAAKECVSV